MRIGELSRRTGVPVPTIKYYVREGLLPAGQLTSPNQASYDDAHERRLRLIRALLDVGGLKVAAIAAGADAICVGGGLADEETVLRLRDALVTAVRDGELPEERLADAAARVRALADWDGDGEGRRTEGRSDWWSQWCG